MKKTNDLLHFDFESMVFLLKIYPLTQKALTFILILDY